MIMNFGSVISFVEPELQQLPIGCLCIAHTCWDLMPLHITRGISSMGCPITMVHIFHSQAMM